MKKIVKFLYVIIMAILLILSQIFFLVGSPLFIIVGFMHELYCWSSSEYYKIDYKEPFLMVIAPINDLLLGELLKWKKN